MQKFTDSYLTTNLQSVFNIMQQFKHDLLNHCNPLTFIQNNLLHESMLPLHTSKDCTIDTNSNIIYGSLKTLNGDTAVDVNVINVNDGTDYCYTVYTDKFDAIIVISVTYDNTGSPVKLCFNLQDLPPSLNSVFCTLGQILNKDEYTINIDDYLIDVFLDSDCTDGTIFPFAAVYITLNF